jgi:uncharacterized protein (UPF0335 family)
MSKTQKVVAINYANLVDRLGALNAQVAPVRDEIAEIKETLRASGYEVVEGKTFRVTVGETKDKLYTDWQAIAKAGYISPLVLETLVDKFSELKQALGAVRCNAKVR